MTLFLKSGCFGVWQRVLSLTLLSLASVGASAKIDIAISAVDPESMQVDVGSVDRREVDDRCWASLQALYSGSVGMARTGQLSYRQALNSEIHESAAYLKAARQGNGVYVHLPYFIPNPDCDEAEILVRAKHILWNGRWISDLARIPARDAAGPCSSPTKRVCPYFRISTWIRRSQAWCEIVCRTPWGRSSRSIATGSILIR